MTRFLLVSLVVLFLPACGSTFGPAVDTLRRSLVFGQSVTPAASLAPGFRYLFVDIGHARAYFIHGGAQPDALGPIDVWMGPDGQVLRLQNGRIMGAVGLGMDWSAVRMRMGPQASSYTRWHDEIPSYRFSVEKQYQVNVFEQVPKKVLMQRREMAVQMGMDLPDEAPVQWLWREDVVVSGKAAERVGVLLRPEAQGWAAVYGEQCLAESVCLKWYVL